MIYKVLLASLGVFHLPTLRQRTLRLRTGLGSRLRSSLRSGLGSRLRSGLGSTRSHLDGLHLRLLRARRHRATGRTRPGVQSSDLVGVKLLSWVFPLRGLVVVVHEVDLPGGGLSLLPAGRKGTKHVLTVASSNIKTVLPQVSVGRVEGEVLMRLLRSQWLTKGCWTGACSGVNGCHGRGAGGGDRTRGEGTVVQGVLSGVNTGGL